MSPHVPNIGETKYLELEDTEADADALASLKTRIIAEDRYPLSPRARDLDTRSFAKLREQPALEPLLSAAQGLCAAESRLV